MKLDTIAFTTFSCTSTVVTCRQSLVAPYLPSCGRLDLFEVAQGLADLPLQVQHPLSALLALNRWRRRDIS